MDEGHDTPSSATSSSSKIRKIVKFNDFGLPVGENSARLSTRSGEIVRTHVPISFTNWRLVPKAKKDELWKLLKVDFVLPRFYRRHCLKKMSEQFRKFRATLRSSYINCFDNIDDILKNVPPTIRQEDWDVFVKQNSSPEAIKTSKKNRENRKCLKIYHTMGRHGHARIEEIMKRETGADKPISRTKVWIKAHTRKDGSISSSAAPYMEKLIELTQSDSGMNSEDLLNDPLTQVFGRDSKGRVRGVGTTVSRSQIQGSAPAISNLAEKETINGSQKADISQMKVEMNGMKETLTQVLQEVQALKQSGIPTTECASSSQPLDGDATKSEKECILLDWYRTTVATGRVIIEAGQQKVHGYPLRDEEYKIVLNVIHAPDAPLPRPNILAVTLGDVGVGGFAAWPKSFVKLL